MGGIDRHGGRDYNGQKKKAGAAVKMKKILPVLVLCLGLLFGCGRKEAAQAEQTQPPQDTQPTLTEPAIDPGYQAIIDRYAVAIGESWDGQRLIDEGLNYLVAAAGFSDPGKELGYQVTDLDGDGFEELLIGTITEDAFYSKMVISLYTLDDAGQPMLVFESRERDRIYYAGGFLFASLGSGSWDNSFVTTVKLEDRELIDMTYTTDPSDYVQLELTPFG